MADTESDSQLQAHIAALAGQINRHKQQDQQQQQQQNFQYRGGGFRGGYRGSNRYVPYPGYGRGRAGYAGYQNRSAVFNTPATPTTPGSWTGYGSETGSTTSGPPNTPKEAAPLTATQARPITRPPTVPKQINRDMAIEGITFRMKEDGSKLTRVSGIIPFLEYFNRLKLRSTDDNFPTTPKVAVVHGVHYQRTKNGNLLRKKVEPPT